MDANYNKINRNYSSASAIGGVGLLSSLM